MLWTDGLQKGADNFIQTRPLGVTLHTTPQFYENAFQQAHAQKAHEPQTQQNAVRGLTRILETQIRNARLKNLTQNTDHADRTRSQTRYTTHSGVRRAARKTRYKNEPLAWIVKKKSSDLFFGWESFPTQTQQTQLIQTHYSKLGDETRGLGSASPVIRIRTLRTELPERTLRQSIRFHQQPLRHLLANALNSGAGGLLSCSANEGE